MPRESPWSTRVRSKEKPEAGPVQGRALWPAAAVEDPTIGFARRRKAMISPNCDKCGTELQEFGAIALSPPEALPDGSCRREVDKYHLCARCWQEFKRWLEQRKDTR